MASTRERRPISRFRFSFSESWAIMDEEIPSERRGCHVVKTKNVILNI
jgi:hypothetical protein